jgi:hypothetical protein
MTNDPSSSTSNIVPLPVKKSDAVARIGLNSPAWPVKLALFAGSAA